MNPSIWGKRGFDIPCGLFIGCGYITSPVGTPSIHRTTETGVQGDVEYAKDTGDHYIPKSIL